MLASPSVDKDRPGLDTEGRFAWHTLEFKSSPGDAMLWSIWVLQRHNVAR